MELERAASAARTRRGVDAGELDRLLSQQRHSAERDKATALAGLKQLYAAELAVRDGSIRELRAQRDSVMASVRQRDAALQARCPSPQNLWFNSIYRGQSLGFRMLLVLNARVNPLPLSWLPCSSRA